MLATAAILATGFVTLRARHGRRYDPRAPANSPVAFAAMNDLPTAVQLDELDLALDARDPLASAARARALAANFAAEGETERACEARALFARCLAEAGELAAARAELESLRAELGRESRAAAVRVLLEGARVALLADERSAARSRAEDAWYLARELARGDLEFDAGVLAALASDEAERPLWRKRAKAAAATPLGRALALRQRAQLPLPVVGAAHDRRVEIERALE